MMVDYKNAYLLARISERRLFKVASVTDQDTVDEYLEAVEVSNDLEVLLSDEDIRDVEDVLNEIEPLK